MSKFENIIYKKADRLAILEKRAAELERLLKKYPAESLMVVGHEPDFTEVISALIGGSLKLPKAGIALVELNHSWRDGRLLWLIPPKIATK